ncbi:MAG: arsenate reductase (glutaredoxin) [Gammaproteobacteria bacterium]|nr:arsenate reductase (glutaredoxin) [Gammaproteobacteria bacterium]
MSTTIYHNPRCSKSRQTLELLNTRGAEPRVVEYLETPPDAATLEQLLTLLKLEPRALMRRQEAEYRDNHLDDTTLSREQLIAAMVAHPKLIERPIVITEHNGQRRAAIGRPPEAVLDIL